MVQRTPISVLIVEDDVSIRTLLLRWIERGINAKVTEAEDGLQALEILAEEPIDLVISDIKMPVLDGIEMLRLLRTDPRNKSLEILMVSHVAAEDSVREVISLGASDYVLKPLQYDKAIQRIKLAERRILDRRATEEATADMPRVVIADPANDFCEVAKTHLSSAFAVRVARSVAEMLVHILRWEPTAVLLSPKLPGLDLKVLFERVKALRPDQWPQFVRLCEPGMQLDQQVAREAGYSAAITKSFVGKTLLDEVSAAVLGLPKTADALSTLADFFEQELTTALYQTLGMMTGAEPEEAPEDDESWQPEIYGRIGIRADDERYILQVGVDSGMPLAAELGLAMLGEPVEGEECKDAFKEVLNVVAGRLRQTCVERSLSVSMQLPEATDDPPATLTEAACRIEKQFIWKGEHRFRISLQAAMLEDSGESAAEAVAEPAGVAASGD
jgi:CheY-like chemotaxis protein